MVNLGITKLVSQLSKMKLLVIDSSYNFEAIVEKKLYEAIYSRDLNGFFTKVWSVHPFGDITDQNFKKKNFGKIDIHEMNKCHSFIEGKIGKFFILKKLKFINFIISQIEFFSF